MSAAVCAVDGNGGGGCGVPPSGAPVLECLSAVSVLMAEVAEARCWSLSDAELVEAVQGAVTVRAQVDELVVRVVAAAHARGLPAASGATSSAAWVAATQRLSRRDAAGLARLGEALERYEATRQTLAAGRVRTEQAGVICAALDELAGSLSAADLVAAERWLLEQADVYGPDELARLGRRVWEYLDPEAAERHEGELMAEAEKRAEELTRLSMRRRGDGTTSGSFRLPDLHADMLRTALEALSSPRRHSSTSGTPTSTGSTPAVDLTAAGDRRGPAGTAGSGPDSVADGEADAEPGADAGGGSDGEQTPVPGRELRPYPVRMGQAFGELIEHLPVDRLPQAGGVAATVTVMIDYDRLVDQVGSATTSTGTRVSAGQARRLACNAGIVPAVLGGDSVCLDLGRTRRLHSRHQRIALGLTQQGCVWPDCDRPPAWTEIHHLHPWSAGGTTDLHAAMLCPRHHRLAHQDWQIRMGADHVPEVIPPARLDPDQTPRRHLRFRQRHLVNAARPAPPRRPIEAEEDRRVSVRVGSARLVT